MHSPDLLDRAATDCLRQGIVSLTDAAARPIFIRSFGELAVHAGEDTVPLRGRARDLLITLLAHGGSTARAAGVANQLWPHGDTGYALGALNTTLYRVRRSPVLKPLFRLADGQIGVDARSASVDRQVVERVIEAVNTALALGPGASTVPLGRLMGLLVALYRGPFLAYEDNEAVNRMRDTLRTRIARVAVDAEQHARSQGTAASDWLARLAASDPALNQHAATCATTRISAARGLAPEDRRPDHSPGASTGA